MTIMIDHTPGTYHAECGPEAVAHQHQYPLTETFPSLWCQRIEVGCSGYIKKIKGDAISHHRKHQEPQSVAGITQSQCPEPYPPGRQSHPQHCHCPESPHHIPDSQHTQCLCDLRDREEHRRIGGRRRTGICRISAKLCDIRRHITVGNLQADAPQHREDQKPRESTAPATPVIAEASSCPDVYCRRQRLNGEASLSVNPKAPSCQ